MAGPSNLLVTASRLQTLLSRIPSLPSLLPVGRMSCTNLHITSLTSGGSRAATLLHTLVHPTLWPPGKADRSTFPSTLGLGSSLLAIILM